MGWVGCSVVSLEICESTNDEAQRLAKEGASHGTVVIANEQTRGRGRLGRSWHSPAGKSLYLSLLVRPNDTKVALPPITLAAGVAVAEALESCGARPTLKWPNDVFLNGRKVAGILTEMNSQNGLGHIVIGIGINLIGETFPEDIKAIATSVLIETGRRVNRDEFLAILCPFLESRLDAYLSLGLTALAKDWESRKLTGNVSVDGQPVGEALGLSPKGGLRVLREDGSETEVMAGDVTFQ